MQKEAFLAFDAAASRELYEHLFGWMEGSLAPLESVTVVANGPLARIPLRSCSPRMSRQARRRHIATCRG